MKNIKPAILIIIILLLPSCLTIKMWREFRCLEDLGYERTGEHIELKPFELLVSERHQLEEKAHIGLSRKEAVHLALKNNRSLQADFQNLGIAKAHLVQAGLLTNPSYDSLNIMPLFDERIPELQPIAAPPVLAAPGRFDLTHFVRFSIGDFWRKPFDALVARDDLDLVIADLEQRILEVKAEVEHAYNFCLFAIEKVAATKAFVTELARLYELIKTNDADKKVKNLVLHAVEVIMGDKINLHVEAQSEVRRAFARLRTIMGLYVAYDSFPLYDRLHEVHQPLSSLEALLEEALANHPQAHRAFYTLERARHAISREKAYTIPGRVLLGFVLTTQSDLHSIGPLATIDVPIFDKNEAQVARAYFVFDQAEKNFLAMEDAIKNNVLYTYDNFITLLEQVNIFDELIKPAFEKGSRIIIEHKEQDKKITDALDLIQELNRFYNAQINYFKTLWQTLDAYAELEFSIGKRISFLNYDVVLDKSSTWIVNPIDKALTESDDKQEPISDVNEEGTEEAAASLEQAA